MNKFSKEKIKKIAKNIIEKIATGEMSQKDIELGGDWYESAKELERVAKGTKIFNKIKPWDQYMGPYALLKNGDKIWLTETPNIYYLETKDKNYQMSEKEIKEFYYKEGNAEKFIKHVTKNKPKKVKKAEVTGYMYDINVNLGKMESGQTDNKEFINNNIKNINLKNTGFKTEEEAIKDMMDKLDKALLSKNKK